MNEIKLGDVTVARVEEMHGPVGMTPEQFFPGWTTFIDGQDEPEESRVARLQAWSGAFMALRVPAGEHTVEFRYRSRLLPLGGGISLLALIGLGFWIWASSRSKSDTAYRAVSE